MFDRPAAFALSVEIADALCRSAYEYRAAATWMGTQRTVDEELKTIETSYAAVGPTVYSGASGIAIFLAEVFAQSREERFARLAAAAVRYSIARVDDVPARTRFGFYTGRVGIAYAALRVGLLVEQPELVDRARSLARSVSSEDQDDFLMDVIAGAAGGAPALLVLARELQMPELSDRARLLGQAMVRTASRSDEGWSWGPRASGSEFPRHLTGFAHGASGIGWSLYELYRAFGDKEFLEGGREAYRYERRWFRGDHDNWPDFRTSDGESSPPSYQVSWCHGAPGIGLARLRSQSIAPDEAMLSELQSAMRTARRSLVDLNVQHEMDYSLCHGQLSLAEILSLGAEALSDAELKDVALATAQRGLDRHVGRPDSWASGVGRGSNPSLMVGLAGIGHFYLRLANPDVPSVLLCGIDTVHPFRTSLSRK